MLQCFSLFYSYMLHIHQLYLVCNPSRLVSLYFFIPRNAMRKRGLCGVCPSVRSVTFVYCIQTAVDIVKLYTWPSSPIILVF